MAEVAASLVLVVSKGAKEVEALTKALASGGFRVEAATSEEEAEALFREHHHALALVDISAPEEAIRVLDTLRAADAKLPVVVMADRSQTKVVARAIERGAYDWIARPVQGAKLVGLVSALVDRRGVMAPPVPLEGGLREEPGFKKIIGSSEKIRNVFESVKVVTASDVPVLIQGETGTGKELVARAIHYRGPRRKFQFFPVNCAAIPETLLESELFGHERGAFTGAVERRKGRFELANGGTLFMDEIGEMASSTQAKILRVIEDHCFQRVGGAELLHADVRIISATNKHLKQEVEVGRFREDLFYRLSVFPIFLPPLRERRNDVRELAEYFLARTAEETGKAATRLSDTAVEAMLSYAWPGNVRELQNTIRRAMLLATEGVIGPEHLGLRETGGTMGEGSIEQEIQRLLSQLHSGEIVPLEKIEEVFIRQALNVTTGNITEAAQRLGVSRSTIYRKLQEYGASSE